MREIKFRAWHEADKEMLYADSHWIAAQMFAQRHDEEFPIMQFTGLHDKNGKEIYEGDIVQVHWPVGLHLYVVKWQNKSGYHLGCWEFTSIANPRHYTGSAGNAIEVVGNIYENPELLEGGE